MKKKSIAVLLGGWSSEREVSLSSGQGVVEALRARGHTVTAIDVTQDLPYFLTQLSPGFDVLFNALHGTGGEDGVIQGVLEMLKIPYTHSRVGASAVAMNKVLSKKIFAFEGIPTPPWHVVNRHSLKNQCPLPLPVVVKPIAEGSSRGVFIVKNDFPVELFAPDWTFGDDVIVEPYLPGREISVAVLHERALGVIELKSVREFYDYTSKYTHGVTQHLMPSPLNEEEAERVCALALKAHKALGCAPLSRADFMYFEGVFYLFEVNTHPGMTPLSLVPEIAAYAGISFGELLEILIEDALER